MTAAIVPDTVRVNGAATVSATGGSGRYTYAITSTTPVGTLSGTRYVAGLMLGTDTITVTDDCANFARVSVQVEAAFEVLADPRERSCRCTSFRLRTCGPARHGGLQRAGWRLRLGGEPRRRRHLPAGTASATDVLLVRDSLTGDQAAVVVTVSPSAQLPVQLDAGWRCPAARSSRWRPSTARAW